MEILLLIFNFGDFGNSGNLGNLLQISVITVNQWLSFDFSVSLCLRASVVGFHNHPVK